MVKENRKVKLLEEEIKHFEKKMKLQLEIDELARDQLNRKAEAERKMLEN